MFALIVFIGIICLLHLVLHLPVVIAVVLACVLWVIWKLKYLILAFIGIEWLLGRDR